MFTYLIEWAYTKYVPNYNKHNQRQSIIFLCGKVHDLYKYIHAYISAHNFNLPALFTVKKSPLIV